MCECYVDDDMTVLTVPSTFPPLRILPIPHTDLIHLCEEVMRNMLFIIILSAQQELHSLGGSVWEHKQLNEWSKPEMRVKLYNACKVMTAAGTIKRRLSTLNQGEDPVPTPPPVLVSMVTVPAMAAVPGAAQGDMDPDVESPVA